MPLPKYLDSVLECQAYENAAVGCQSCTSVPNRLSRVGHYCLKILKIPLNTPRLELQQTQEEAFSLLQPPVLPP